MMVRDGAARLLTMRTALLLLLVLLAAGGAWRPARGEAGLASWYSGGGTACGDRTVAPFTAAHKSLPCGTLVRVTTPEGRSVVVTIRDRGPFVRGRIIDLDRASAGALGLIGPGLLPVTVERIR
jgi:rare lipoprotein A